MSNAVWTVILIMGFFLAALLPAMGVVFVIASVIAGIMLCYRTNAMWVAVEYFGCMICVAMVSGDFLSAGMLMISCMVPCLLIVVAFRRQFEYKITMAMGTGGFLLGYLCQFFVYQLLHGQNMYAVMLQNDREAIADAVVTALSASGTMSGGVESANVMVNQLFEMILLCIPAVLMIISAMLAGFAIWAAAAFLKKEGFSVVTIPIARFYAAKGWGLVYILTIILSLGDDAISGFGLNIFILLSAYFCVCGFAVIDFYMKKRFTKVYLRCMIYIPAFLILSSGMLFVSPVLILIFAGILDMIFDFRKLRLKKIS